MTLFSMIKDKDINAGMKWYRSVEGAVLLDVRTAEEYGEGHIPGSINIPFDELEKIKESVTDAFTPIYVYCETGEKSDEAALELKKMGYYSVTELGGIAQYQGELVKE